MLHAQSPFSTPSRGTALARAIPVLRWALSESPATHTDSTPFTSKRSARKSSLSSLSAFSFGKDLSVWAKVSALRNWVSGTSEHECHADSLWKGDQHNELICTVNALQNALSSDGLTGLVGQLMGKDPLEKQILLHRLLSAIRPDDEHRQQVVDLARATAVLERSTLDFLHNTATIFSPFDNIVFDGARRLRAAIHELGESAQHGDIKATDLARVILSRLDEMHFDDVMRLLRQGIKSDLRSHRPSALSMQLLSAMANKSIFSGVQLCFRVSAELRQQLMGLGLCGHFAVEDLARVLLVAAESGTGELHYLLSRYLGPEATESISAHPGALEAFKKAIVALPIALWPAATVQRRDRLVSHIDRLLDTLAASAVTAS